VAPGAAWVKKIPPFNVLDYFNGNKKFLSKLTAVWAAVVSSKTEIKDEYRAFN